MRRPRQRSPYQLSPPAIAPREAHAVTFKRIPFQNALPEADVLQARMFRLVDRTALKMLGPDEAEQEMVTLASTLMRATYHRRRFAWIVGEATARYNAHGANIIFDQIAKYIAFEAAGVLGAARSFVDGVYYVARRRTGATLDQVDDVPISQAITNPQSAAHGLPELGVLRGQHLKWYEALNLYRNVLVHVGAGDSMAYFPAGVVLPAGVAPSMNVMVLPDFGSLKAQIPVPPGQKKKKRASRTTRPHEWTYRRNTRLDTLVKDSYEGLLTFARAIGILWGGSLPTRGDTDWIDAVVLREI